MVNVPPSVSKQVYKVDKPKQGLDLAKTDQPVYFDLSSRSYHRPIDYLESWVAQEYARQSFLGLCR